MAAPTTRKPHRDWVGYVTERRNKITGDFTVVVDATVEPVWLDPDGGRWVTMCNAHGTLCNHTSLRLARAFMVAGSHNWCEPCVELAGAGGAF